PLLVEAVAGLGGDVVEERLLLQELVALHLDALDERRVGRIGLGLLGRDESSRGQEEDTGEQEVRQPEPHAERLPPRPSCQYQSAPFSTPTSMGREARICPRMNASESASSMWRWMARRSGRAP